MIYAKINAQQQAQLDAEMKSATDTKWYRRLKVIDLSGQGYYSTTYTLPPFGRSRYFYMR